jgi:microcystin degradation protein MlrC
MLYWSWAHATVAGLVKSDTHEEIRDSSCRRILIAQSLYAGRRGALLHQHASEHRGDRARAVELRDCAAAVATAEELKKFEP